MSEIREYINSISKYKEYSFVTYKDETAFRFFGDGQGDSEEIGNSATKEVVENYILDCQEQIEIAKEYLKTKGTSNGY
jgi:hypothetical protein